MTTKQSSKSHGKRGNYRWTSTRTSQSRSWMSVALREAPPKLRDKLLVNSQQFESNFTKLRSVVQAYLDSNKSWTANDFRSDKRARPDGRRLCCLRTNTSTKQRSKEAKKLSPTDKPKTAPVREETSLCARLLVTKPPRHNSERGGKRKNGCRRSKTVRVHYWKQGQ